MFESRRGVDGSRALHYHAGTHSSQATLADLMLETHLVATWCRHVGESIHKEVKLHTRFTRLAESRARTTLSRAQALLMDRLRSAIWNSGPAAL
jgi:hypothetical protein